MHIKYKGKRFHSSSIYFPTVKPSTRLINDGGNFSCLNTYIIIQCLLLMFLYVAARLRGGREVEAAVLEAVVTPIVRLLLLSVLSHNAVNV